jgi:proteasome accessory factor A
MRERVFGIETEYAVIYRPPRAGGPVPNKFALYRHFEQALRRRVPSLPNAFSPFREKVGRFLANGGTFHYEATMEHFEHGLIEMASPECRDPLTLLRYERAKDELIEELAGEVNQVLEVSGARGEVRIGKNNVDSQGHGFGSHENYWVEDPLAPAALCAFAVLWLGVWAVSLPVLAFVLAVRIVATIALLLFGLGLAVSLLVAGLLSPRLGLRLRLFATRLGQRLEERPGEIGRYLQHLVAPMYPLFALHSALYNLFHFRPFRRALTGFLVTRIVYTGAGAVSFDGGPLFRLSQRAPFLRAIARIFSDGERRPVYETRDLFFRPWSALRSRRRLHLMVGEANLCEQALLLRVGATALVLEAIEARVDVDWPVLADPLAAMRTLSEQGLDAELELADGTRASAVEIQRRYLAAARRATRDQALPLWKERVLRDWHETLDLLESDASALADRVDWIAKRELVHAEVPDARDREALRRRGAEVLKEDGARTAADRQLRALGYRLWRVDLRYHELGPRGGHRRLERRGLVRRLTTEAGVERARGEPPPDTRARARGAAIRDAHRQALSGGAAWHRVRIGKFGWRWFRDPLDAGRDDPGT